MAKRKVNTCFACGDTAYTTEHHVKELDGKITVELCGQCHVALNHYQEEALPKLKEFISKDP